MSAAASAPALSSEDFEHAAECLKTIAHPHRLRMIQMMLSGRHTVGDLAQACGIAPHMASEHLRLMKRCGLLEGERDGRRTYYRVIEPQLQNVMSCVEGRFARR
jgi:DNA-binding transcriptional ArsR family regulator